MIKNIVFDLGGVVVAVSAQQAIKRFEEIGLDNAAEKLDTYHQTGIFGDLEMGNIDAETFRKELSKMTGRELTHEECRYAWCGFCLEVPQRNLDALDKLRKEGYRVILLSNTNPFIMEWASSADFSPSGRNVYSYFDACYLSYECKMMKPDEMIFRHLLTSEKIFPEETLFLDDGPRNVAAASELGIRTFCPVNNEDWTQKIYDFINK